MRVVWVGLLASMMTVCHAAPPASEVLIRPAAAPGPLDNPLKGWCPFTIAGTIHQPYSMVYLNVPWKVLEPEEGRYGFEQWEQQAWAARAAQGKHIVFRVYVDSPSHPSGLPDWLKQKGIKLSRYTHHGGGDSPNYDAPEMVTAMERLIDALGRRYDGNPRVAFIQLGLLGFWGEWHTWPRSELYASRATEQRVIQAYRRAFPHKILMARYARDDAGMQPWLGFHDDMFPEDTDNGQDWSFLAGLRKSGRAENWKRAAIGGEMVPHQAKAWLGKGYEQTEEMLRRSHFTWVGPYCPALHASSTPEYQRRSEELVRQMGYQFQLTEVRHPATVAVGGTSTVTIRGVNEGVAPFYYPWPVELSLIDGSGKVAERFPLPCDVRTWQPGPFEVAGTFEIKAPPGRYRLALGIRDPWKDRPAIGFANLLSQHEGWTILGPLDVEAGR
ncbi:DUF4832 domain-containing protein [Singulisphaera sp. Ch08]|uniref:DUF4832 domain-containing protein n=1 Tax=Singulisphaera sp. Ch08 TaxID=3120278 RepID=A0AAU7CJ89_9BACT